MIIALASIWKEYGNLDARGVVFCKHMVPFFVPLAVLHCYSVHMVWIVFIEVVLLTCFFKKLGRWSQFLSLHLPIPSILSFNYKYIYLILRILGMSNLLLEVDNISLSLSILQMIYFCCVLPQFWPFSWSTLTSRANWVPIMMPQAGFL